MGKCHIIVCNLIGRYHFLGISSRNLTLFTRPFLSERCVQAQHTFLRQYLIVDEDMKSHSIHHVFTHLGVFYDNLVYCIELALFSKCIH